ncbi:hypothetical protein [Pelagerythrobacter rhizovicinus]|uniref:DUF3106 domain-containing protein n=1 Tax=Pelagerythrobacter rhizovicinus TaxID=2268576 RepID=A0A4Q2KKY9_9SPHN|nr:hypothetical protein [Pelagerythrobacter rhizovicinus]RXZ63963.1 hypothetical protein ETX26_08445 [Pelagerythrobacter rhizovicinus]
MRIRNLLPAVAAVAIVSGPALAQDTEMAEPPVESAEPADTATSTGLAPDQQSAYDAWPPAQQAQYDAWPAETQTYFWSLTPERQELFWRISDGDKSTLATLPPEQQTQAWAQIESQAAAMPAPTDPAGDPATADPADPTAADPTSPDPMADPTATDPSATDEPETDEPM